jgi:hypothetical protein
MKIVALTLAAAALVSAAPVLASPPPTRPIVHYYVTDGRTKLAGPFASFYACNARLGALQTLHGDAIFCASDWIKR